MSAVPFKRRPYAPALVGFGTLLVAIAIFEILIRAHSSG
jgi:hypothetical protein